MEWEGGNNRSVQIADGPCSVAFEWGNEGSLRVELSNGKAPSEDGITEGVPHQEPLQQVRKQVTTMHAALLLSEARSALSA